MQLPDADAAHDVASAGVFMIDREKVLTVLRRRFPGAGPEDLAAAANAIVGMPDEWEDITALEPDLHAHLARACGDDCIVARCFADDAEVKLFRRRRS